MNVALLSSTLFPLFVLEEAELHVGVEQLAERAARGSGHFPLHGEQLFFFIAECVRFETEQTFEHQQAARSESLIGQEFVHFWPAGWPCVSRRMKTWPPGPLSSPCW